MVGWPSIMVDEFDVASWRGDTSDLAPDKVAGLLQTLLSVFGQWGVVGFFYAFRRVHVAPFIGARRVERI